MPLVRNIFKYPHLAPRPRRASKKPDVTLFRTDTSEYISAGCSDVDVYQTERNLVEQVQGLVHEELHEVGRRLAPHSRINDLKTHSW